MSTPHKESSWSDSWWSFVVILFGLLFVTLLVTFNPTW